MHDDSIYYQLEEFRFQFCFSTHEREKGGGGKRERGQIVDEPGGIGRALGLAVRFHTQRKNLPTTRTHIEEDEEDMTCSNAAKDSRTG